MAVLWEAMRLDDAEPVTTLKRGGMLSLEGSPLLKKMPRGFFFFREKGTERLRSAATAPLSCERCGDTQPGTIPNLKSS